MGDKKDLFLSHTADSRNGSGTEDEDNQRNGWS